MGLLFVEKLLQENHYVRLQIYITHLLLQTKKNFKVLMEKIFDDEEITFKELFDER